MSANQRNKARVLAYWQAVDTASADTLAAVTAEYLPAQFVCKGPAPVGQLDGPQAMAEQWLAPLKRAIPDLQRQTHLFLGGQSIDHVGDDAKDAYWVAGTGYLSGTATGSFLGIPATGHSLRIRWSEFIRFNGDQMLESQLLIDFVDWFDQIDLSVLPHPLGAAHVYPAATGYDGVLLDAQCEEQSAHTLKLGHELLYGALNGFDESELSSMGMAHYFHPNMKWYGPGGIGACLSLEEFEQLHQQPWLIAFPDRKIVGLESLISEGQLLAASGVAGVCATHTGPYLDQAATGLKIEFSGIDFWLLNGDQFTENWVFVDMIDMFGQMGVDLFERMAVQRDAKAPTFGRGVFS